MKKTIIGSLCLLMLVSFSIVPATAKKKTAKAIVTSVKKKGTNKTLDVYVYCNVEEFSGGGAFFGWASISEEVCDDIEVEVHYRVNEVMQYHTITIYSKDTYGSDVWGGGTCPPAYSGEAIGVNSVSPSTSCGTVNFIYYN